MQTMQSTASTIFSTYASFAGSVMLIRTMANDFIPKPLRSHILSAINYLFNNTNPHSNNFTLVVEKKMGMIQNEVYDAAEIYLSNKIDPKVNRLRVAKNPKQKKLSLTIVKNQEVSDTFRNVKLKWKVLSIEPKNNVSEGKNFFELSFNRKFKDMVLNEYLPSVISEAKRLKDINKVVKLYTKNCPYPSQVGPRGGWGCITLDHPSTFDTLAMDTHLKKAIMEDLDKFLKRKEFYKRVGKAWKRGYLLYGPPGTGKSSLIAAMANYLQFDIYDVELTSLQSDSELRKILLSTTNRSIIVIEDIDCSAKMQNRSRPSSLNDDDVPLHNSKLTLSGLLNFIDGLWSSCGDERIIVFTTNHKDKIDPALLRPGRMDMHIHMSYCTSQSFKILAFNYLGVGDDHRLFADIDGLIKSVQVTPAEVAEELLRSEDPDIALNGVLNLLKRKKGEVEDVNAMDGLKLQGVKRLKTNDPCYG